MFAVYVREAGDREAIEKSADHVATNVVPRTRQAPGIVSAYRTTNGSGGTPGSGPGLAIPRHAAGLPGSTAVTNPVAPPPTLALSPAAYPSTLAPASDALPGVMEGGPPW